MGLNLAQLKRVGLQAAAIIGVWSLVFLLAAAQIDLAARITGRLQPWAQTLPGSLLWCGIWALLTPTTVWLGRRFDLLRGQAPLRNLAIHVAAAIVTVMVQAMLVAAIGGFFDRGHADFAKTFHLQTIKLFGSLHFNLMVYAIIVGLVELAGSYAALRDREIADSRLKAQLAEAQTAALRAQLQPHFLFNALNTIAASAHDDPVLTVRLIARVGDLLRLSMEGPPGQWTSLAEELVFADAYLAIESERLGDRLRIVKDIEPDALAARLPSLVIQPLVENAVRHGLAPRARGGELILRARRVGDRLHLTVADNGSGAKTVTEGVGLRNTRLRLTQLYGARHIFAVESEPGQGFTVRIEIPYDPSPDR